MYSINNICNFDVPTVTINYKSAKSFIHKQINYFSVSSSSIIILCRMPLIKLVFPWYFPRENRFLTRRSDKAALDCPASWMVRTRDYNRNKYLRNKKTNAHGGCWKGVNKYFCRSWLVTLTNLFRSHVNDYILIKFSLLSKLYL